MLIYKCYDDGEDVVQNNLHIKNCTLDLRKKKQKQQKEFKQQEVRKYKNLGNK